MSCIKNSNRSIVNDNDGGALILHNNSTTNQKIAIEYNNVGIRFLQTSKLNQAYHAFQKALLYLKDQHTNKDSSKNKIGTTHELSGPSLSATKSNAETNDCMQTFGCQAYNLNVHSIKLPGTENSSTSDNDSSFVLMYDRAFYIVIADPLSPPPELRLHSRSMILNVLLNSLVSYNLALTHQKLATQTGASTDLIKSIRMYEASYQIIQPCIAYVDDNEFYDENNQSCLKRNGQDNCRKLSDLPKFYSNEVQISLLLILSLFNNIAHILSILYRLEDMKRMLKHLTNALHYVNNNINNNFYHSFLEISTSSTSASFRIELEEYILFHMNARVVAKETILCATPAA